jgi:glycosyltransferase involved in cell wall biosynthesis
MGSAIARVTVGLPVFNAERYLKAALDSILSQTYRDFTLVISDNASTDRTQEICQAYARSDARIQYTRQERNLGAVPNFNRVFELSTSEYFKWAPYDDLIAPGFVAGCVQVLDDHPDVVVCYSRAKIIGEHGEFEVDYNPGPDTSSQDPQMRFRSLMLHPEYGVQQMGLIRSAALRKTGLHGSFPSSDEILLAELALLGRFHEIPDRLYMYRRHAGQSTRGAQRTRIHFFDTSLDGRILLPTWMYFGAALRVIAKHSLTAQARLSCYLSLLRWLFAPAHFRAMGKDVLLALNELTIRTLGASRFGANQVGRMQR